MIEAIVRTIIKDDKKLILDMVNYLLGIYINKKV